jgi:hypothetical protein
MPYLPTHLERWNTSPTAYDSAANYCGADLSAFYVAPISNTRDTSDALTLSNWRVISAELDKLIGHDESGAHSFGHWACGWYELYLIHETDTEALKCADEWAASLADYPVADESDWSELEHEQEYEHWDSWGRRDWRKCVESALQTYAPEDADIYWADELIDATPDSDTVLDTLWSDCHGETYHESDGPNFYFERAAECLDASLLSDAFSMALNGATLLPLDQQWRREPYPWPGAEPEPLVAALPLSH